MSLGVPSHHLHIHACWGHVASFVSTHHQHKFPLTSQSSQAACLWRPLSLLCGVEPARPRWPLMNRRRVSGRRCLSGEAESELQAFFRVFPVLCSVVSHPGLSLRSPSDCRASFNCLQPVAAARAPPLGGVSSSGGLSFSWMGPVRVQNPGPTD